MIRVLKIIFLGFWIVCTALFVVGALTPLEFTSKIVMYGSFIIAFNGAFALRFLLTDFISLKIQKAALLLVVSLAVCLTYHFTPRLNPDWKIQQIMFRNKSNPEDIITFQKEKYGEFRTVKIISFTPLFNYVVELKQAKADGNWNEVNEFISDTE